MSFAAEITACPAPRGRLTPGASMAEFSWFRAGGPADAVFSPADEDDLAAFLAALPAHVPVTVVGVGSNLLVRDGGVAGLVIRLGRGFGETVAEEGWRIRAGCAVPDMKLAQAAAAAGIAGLEFYRGIPGTVGGACRMNAGAHGTETKDVLVSARAVTRAGATAEFTNAEMGFAYRHCAAAADGLVFISALFGGRAGVRAEIEAGMAEVTAYREAKQPTRARTGGSTFKNPPGHSAWKLIDAAGCRGLRVGGVHVSELHCNFLINDAEATAEDIEALGEAVRARVFETSGLVLEWEIKRIGRPLPGREVRVFAPPAQMGYERDGAPGAAEAAA